MAQVFTFEFSFRHQVHSAIATVRTIGGEWAVSIQVLGDGLPHIVPEGEMLIRFSNASRSPSAAPRPGFNELERTVREAVAVHLRRGASPDADIASRPAKEA